MGCPSSGKTTLANKLGVLLNIKVYHLDKIFWVEKQGIKQDIFLVQQEEIMMNNTWIIDGGFVKSKSYGVRLNNADTVIFFAFSKVIIYWRLLKRAIRYFNKLRPDMGGSRKDHLNWQLVKYIWNYDTKEEYKKIMEYLGTKKLIVIRNFQEEKDFFIKEKLTL